MPKYVKIIFTVVAITQTQYAMKNIPRKLEKVMKK